MSYNETPLSDAVSYAFEGGPEYNTLRKPKLQSARVRKKVLWAVGKHRYRATYRRLKPEHYYELLAAFHASAGSAYGFLFKDWLDYQATNEPLGAAPAGSSPVQLQKTYVFGTRSRTRPIKKPKAGTVVVEEYNGSAWVAKAGTLDATTGLFTPSAAWITGADRRWSGEFYVPVCFATDYMPANYEDWLAITTPVVLEEDMDA